MDISKIDKNMASICFSDDGFDFYPVPSKNVDLYGVSYNDDLKCFTRFDNNVAKKVSEQVEYLSRTTAGGRVRFATNSTHIKIKVKWSTKAKMNQMSSLGSSGFSLLQNYEDGTYHFMGGYIPDFNADDGFEATLASWEERRKETSELRYFTLSMPLYNEVKELYIGVEKGSILTNGLKYKDISPILFYGSSITQGGCASRADNFYEGFISKWLNVDIINVGLSGRCKGEQVLVDYLSTIKCSMFVLDYDHNAPSVEHLKETHYNVYDTFRKAQPNTPILIISKPDYNWYPIKCKSKERLNIIKSTYNKAIKNGDKNVYFIDGRKLFQGMYDDCTIEGCHPNDLGFYLMAKTISKVIKKVLKI